MASRTSCGSRAPPRISWPSTESTSGTTPGRGGCRRRAPDAPRAPRVGCLRARVARRQDDVDRGVRRPRMADAGSRRLLRRLHAGPRLPCRFRHVPPRGALPPAGRRARICHPGRLSRASRPAAGPRGGARRPSAPAVPCHNDLLAENYLDDGARLWIVDYEYSGNNDPTFELGNTCQELGWDDARIAPAVRGVLRDGHGCPRRPDAPPDDHVRCRLDAVGGHPGGHQHDRLRLRGLGRRALGAGAGGARWRRPRGLAGGRRGHRPARPAAPTGPRRSAALQSITRAGSP